MKMYILANQLKNAAIALDSATLHLANINDPDPKMRRYLAGVSLNCARLSERLDICVTCGHVRAYHMPHFSACSHEDCTCTLFFPLDDVVGVPGDAR